MGKNSIKLSVTVPQDLKDSMLSLSIGKANAAIRASLTAASKPSQTFYKQQLRALTKSSEQSTGATLRAVQKKTTYPLRKKTTPGSSTKGYIISAIDRKREEIHRRSTAGEYKRRGLKGNQRRSIGVVTSVGGRKKKRYVSSYQRTSLRQSATTKKGRQKNIPNKYWHLINNGFSGAGRGKNASFSGYHFAVNNIKRVEVRTVDIFRSQLRVRLARVL